MFGTLTCRFVQAFCCLAVAGAELATREPSVRLLDETEVAVFSEVQQTNLSVNRPMREHDVGIWKSFFGPRGMNFYKQTRYNQLIPVLSESVIVVVPEGAVQPAGPGDTWRKMEGPIFFKLKKFMEKKTRKNTAFLTNGGGVERNGYRLHNSSFGPPKKPYDFLLIDHKNAPNRRDQTEAWQQIPEFQDCLGLVKMLWRRTSCGGGSFESPVVVPFLSQFVVWTRNIVQI